VIASGAHSSIFGGKSNDKQKKKTLLHLNHNTMLELVDDAPITTRYEPKSSRQSPFAARTTREQFVKTREAEIQ